MRRYKDPYTLDLWDQTHTCLSKTHSTFHRLEIIPVYKSFAPQKVFFSQIRSRRHKEEPRAFHCQALSFLFFAANNTSLFISAITAQTDSSLAQLSSPITFISTSNLISPKERKANKQRRAERQREKKAIMSICVGSQTQLYVFVCVYWCIFPLCFSISFCCCCCCPHSFYLLFFFHRKKAFKGAIVQSGWSGLLVSGQQSNTTNMASTNQGPG